LRHWSQHLQATASGAWSAIDLYGLPVEPGRVTARLAAGVASLDPLDVGVGEQGRLQATGRILLDPPPQRIQLPRGEIVRNVHITPEVSDAVLKYIAPILAQVTRSEGLFSVALEGGEVPLANPNQATLSGRMTIHAARVQPGPFAQAWLLQAEQIEALIKRRPPPQMLSQNLRNWIVIDDCTVDFRLVEGRVHHEGLELAAGGLMIRSRGSVGLDETLDLLLEVPMPDEWVQREPWLQSLGGQTIRLKVRGTFSRPRLDRRAIQEIGDRILEGAAGAAVEDGINWALDRLLRPSK
jgi:hypothetical protein